MSFRFDAADMDNETWRTGSIAHYLEPAYYDKCYRSRLHDVQFYETLVKQRFVDADILAYGCGNGRIELPLARAGARVWGVDLSKPMLDDFRRLLRDEPSEVRRRVKLRQADMRSFSIRRKFDLVLCTFNTFLHLYTHEHVMAWLKRVRRHLKPDDGRLLFDASIPAVAELERDPLHPYVVPRLRVPPSNQLVRYKEFFDYDRYSQVLSITMQFEPIDPPGPPWATLLTHRQFFPQEIVSLLSCAGFEVVKIWPDFGDGEPSDAIDSMVWEARIKGRGSR